MITKTVEDGVLSKSRKVFFEFRHAESPPPKEELLSAGHFSELMSEVEGAGGAEALEPIGWLMKAITDGRPRTKSKLAEELAQDAPNGFNHPASLGRLIQKGLDAGALWYCRNEGGVNAPARSKGFVLVRDYMPENASV